MGIFNNEAGIVLAFFVSVYCVFFCRRNLAFSLVILAYFALYMAVDYYLFGPNPDCGVDSPCVLAAGVAEGAVQLQYIPDLIAFGALFGLSMQMATLPGFLPRVLYVAFTGAKAFISATYVASMSLPEDLHSVQRTVEVLSIIPDVLVLLSTTYALRIRRVNRG